MISNNDRKILTEVGREYILDIAFDSKYLKDRLTFREHVILCDQVKKLTYEEVIALTITEDVREFEGKFSKFLKYSIVAVASMVSGPFTPPVGMFLLYLYRKATDTCVRACYKKLPLSKERKICKYTCQVSAAKEMANQLRGEISKCSQVSKPAKCEKKLQKQYIKWAKRVEQLTVKLNHARSKIEDKARKVRQKETLKKAKTLSAGLEIPKSQLVKFVVENETLRSKISFKQHLYLYKTCQAITEEKDEGRQPFKIDPKKEKLIRMLMMVGMWSIPIPFFGSLMNYMVKKYNVGCAAKCVKSNKLSRRVCYSQCTYMGAQYAIKVLNQQLSKCSKADNPPKCQKKIYKMLGDWKQREVERKIKFEYVLRRDLAKAKLRNQKEKGHA